MRAIRFEEPGDADVLTLAELETPEPDPDEVLVEVAAAGVNFIDTYHRSGLYPMSLPSGIGLEGAGEVVAVGDEVTDRRPGDRVAWSDALGSYATHLTVPAERTVLLPDGIDAASGAATMLQGMTAHYLSHSTFQLDRGHTALVYAAAGGVGRLLVQLAKRRGARVLACTSTEEKAEHVRALGADEIVFYRDEDVAARAHELTDGTGVDVVYDSVGQATFESSLASLRPRGLMVLYGASSGPVPPTDPQVLAKNGSLYLTRPTLGHYTATSDELAWRAGALFELQLAGQLELAIHARYPLAEAAQAHRDLESGTTSGKLLLEP
jgi:NADPH:quinone reductase